MLIPNFVGLAQAAAPFILCAIIVALFVLGIENWPEKPTRRR